MDQLTLSPPSAKALHPLPCARTRTGNLRRVGVEVELGGLTEEQVAIAVRDVLGGQIETLDPGRVVKDTSLGDIEVYLDSRWLTDAGEGLRDVARHIVPVEIVTAPIVPEDIAQLDDLMTHLRKLGATGTNAGMLLGFGVHFNPEVTGETLDDILPTLTAFALSEDALRAEAQIDLSRRMMPFVGPYPRKLVDALAEGGIADLKALIELYLRLAPSRNHGLDMLALFAHLDHDAVAGALDMASITGRPTYHYRLPDCRIDEEGWSLVLEWNRWVRVEEIAANSDLLKQLADAWIAHRSALTTLRGDWAVTSGAILKKEDL